MGLLYGRTGRANTKNAGFRPGQAHQSRFEVAALRAEETEAVEKLALDTLEATRKSKLELHLRRLR
jgi:hypothetical protein